MELSASPSAAQQAILAVLAGTPLRQAAADILMDPADLADGGGAEQQVGAVSGLIDGRAVAEAAGWLRG